MGVVSNMINWFVQRTLNRKYGLHTEEAERKSAIEKVRLQRKVDDLLSELVNTEKTIKDKLHGHL